MENKDGSPLEEEVGVDWQITRSPEGSNPRWAGEMSTREDAKIIYKKYLALGSLPGEYTAETSCGECTEGSPQSFTATAICPDVPLYRQYSYPNDPYDNWCKILDQKTGNVIGKASCQCQILDNTDPSKIIGEEVCQYKGGELKPNYRLKPGYEYYSIKAKGCALTSLSMVMGRYGSAASPLEWNKFMTQSGGYSDAGDLQWKSAAMTNNELLYYRFDGAYKDNAQMPLEISLLDNYLYKCMPIIVKVKNWKQRKDGTWYWGWHWVVVTGNSENSYTIYDPGYADRMSLSSHKYNNEVYAIRIYENKTGGCQ